MLLSPPRFYCVAETRADYTQHRPKNLFDVIFDVLAWDLMLERVRKKMAAEATAVKELPAHWVQAIPPRPKSNPRN
jgi:hypothetical protein